MIKTFAAVAAVVLTAVAAPTFAQSTASTSANGSIT